MLMFRSSAVMPIGLRSQFILPGTLSGAGLVAIHLLGGTSAASMLNLAPQQSGVPSIQGATPIGAVDFSNAGYAAFPGGTGIVPSILSPYFETADFTVAMAVRSTGTFTGSNVLYYCRTFGNDPSQSGSPGVGSLIQLTPQLNGLSSWSAVGTAGNQSTPSVSGDVAVEGNWHWLSYKVNSTSRVTLMANTTAALSSTLTATGVQPRNPNATLPWSFGGAAVSVSLQQPCNVAAITLFSRALSTAEDLLLYQTMAAYLAGAQSITI
jgi:hypothetical protein